jgi:hypothetical protein
VLTFFRPFIHSRRHVARATMVGTVADRTRSMNRGSPVEIGSNAEVRVPLASSICESVYMAGMNVNWSATSVSVPAPLSSTASSKPKGWTASTGEVRGRADDFPPCGLNIQQNNSLGMSLPYKASNPLIPARQCRKICRSVGDGENGTLVFWYTQS